MTHPVPFEAELAGWIVDQSLAAGTLETLLNGVGLRLRDAGLPLFRLFVAMPMVSPDIRAGIATWDHVGGFMGEGVRHDAGPDAFLSSPFKPMLDEGITQRRWRLGPETRTGYAILDRLAAEGATDYLGHLVSFDERANRAMRGAAISFASNTPDGFAAEHVALLGRLTPLLGLAVLRFATTFVLDEILGCYVGRGAGERILRGEMRRGEGHMLQAALLFADLRGFTRAADRDGPGLVSRLGRHLAAMVEPVEAEGGEVLKFLGDGLLATFAIDGEEAGAACAAALRAAREAVRRNRDVNAAFPETEPLALDVALHRGEVFYGNIGAGSRLDFTVIGPAVNECSRIERLCDALDRPILMSGSFAGCCGATVVSLGAHALRGVAEPRELFALP